MQDLKLKRKIHWIRLFIRLYSIGDKNEEVTTYLKEVQTWLEEHQDEDVSVYEEKIKEIQEKVQSVVSQCAEEASAANTTPENVSSENDNVDTGPKIEEID